MKRLTSLAVTSIILLLGTALFAQPRSLGGRSIILDDNVGNESYITTSQGGVGINMFNMAPHPCAILDLNSQTKGFLVPRMVPAEIAALCGGTPPEGLIVYNTLTHTLNVWNGQMFTGHWQTTGNTNLFSDNVDNLLGSTPSSTVKAFNLIVDGLRIVRYETNNRIIGGHSTNTIQPNAHNTVIAGGGASLNANMINAAGTGSAIGGGLNNVANGASTTIAGGSGNRTTDDYASVLGGQNNRAGNNAGTTADATHATVAGGTTNIASGQFSTVAGGSTNTASGNYSTVGGGFTNNALGISTFIGGGANNTATNNDVIVGAGLSNTASGLRSAILGGQSNTATGDVSTIGGGFTNAAAGTGAVIAGGWQNTTSSDVTTIGGGISNLASGNRSSILGGDDNTASADYSTVGGGFSNDATGISSFIGGGANNTASNNDAVIAGGISNTASGYRSTIQGGEANLASGNWATLGGGYNNVASGIGSVVGGGGYDGSFTGQNIASGHGSTIGGGRANQATGIGTTIGGGPGNIVQGPNSVIGGGAGNFIAAAANLATIAGGNLNVVNFNNGTIAGGLLNTNSGVASFIGGGFQNTTVNNDAFIGAGINNTAAFRSVVAGGETNIAGGNWSTIGGGISNDASGPGTFVGGGNNNTASNNDAVVAGGINNTASGFRSSIGGGEGNNTTSNYTSTGGGIGNIVNGPASTIGGGAFNTIALAANLATIAGGNLNVVNFNNGTIAGGLLNTNSGVGSFIGGGFQNQTINNDAVVAGGNTNIAGFASAIGGGSLNSATGAFNAIPGGQNLTVGNNSFGYNIGTAANVSGQSNIAYFGNVDVLVGNTDNTAQQLRFYENNASATLAGADFASFQAPAAMTATTQYALPVSFGTSGIAPYFLADVTGAGSPRQLTWVSGNSSNWLLTGNSGTNSAINFIGTTDAADFVIRTGVGAVERMRFFGAPSLNSSIAPLIAINNPNANQQGLRINGTTDAIPGFGGSTLAANPGVWDLAVIGDAVITGVTKMGGSLWFDGINTPHNIKANTRLQFGTLTDNDLSFITNNVERMYVDSTGKIGIGTKDPVSFLHVRGVPPTVDSVNGAGMLIPRPFNHLVTIENVSTDEKGNGIAIILNAPGGIGPPQDVHVNNNQNYITFYSEPYAKAIRGRIEGFSWQNYWNTINAVGQFALDNALDLINPLNYLTFNLDFFDFDPNFISYNSSWVSFDATFVHITWPTLNYCDLTIPMPPGIPNIPMGNWPCGINAGGFSLEPPVSFTGSPFIINGSPIINLENPISLNWGFLNNIINFAANLPYKDKIAEFVTNRPAAAMKFAANFFGGVTYESGSGDYAEWLERADPAEKILPGDVVGIVGGKITKNTEGTDHFMVATWKPIVLGNMPPEDREQDFTKVAFLGQVPVKIKGGCRKGDYILPSGGNDGFARALSPERIDAADLDNILGVAWEDTYELEPTFAKVAVGLKPNEMVTVIQKQQAQIENLQEKVNEIDLLKQEMAELKEAVSSAKLVSTKKSEKKSKFRYKTTTSK